MSPVSVKNNAELRGAVLALKAVDRDIRNAINRATRRELNPIWQDELAGKVAGLPRVDQLVLGRGARVRAGNPVTLRAASSTRPLSGGLVPNLKAKGFEFGTDNRDATSTYTRRNRRNGGSHSVTRRTLRHLPARAKSGRAVWPAVSGTAPRLASLWVQIIVKTINDAAEGK